MLDLEVIFLKLWFIKKKIKSVRLRVSILRKG